MTSQRGGVSNLRGWHRAGLVKGFLVSLHSGHAPKSDCHLLFISRMIKVLTQAENPRPLSRAHLTAESSVDLGSEIALIACTLAFFCFVMSAYIRDTAGVRQFKMIEILYFSYRVRSDAVRYCQRKGR